MTVVNGCSLAVLSLLFGCTPPSVSSVAPPASGAPASHDGGRPVGNAPEPLRPAVDANVICGNGQLEAFEACDDGNTRAGDGCDDHCLVETGFLCATPGKPCRAVELCGDRRLTGQEACDDGNARAGDGCAANCQPEPGWTCPMGGVCRAARCGDGIVVGAELCDDGNATGGDGCSADCLVESPGPAEADGWVCPAPGQACQRTHCGDGKQEGSEQCDDGNSDLGDGCTPFCRQEPTCPITGGSCSSVCGDGLLLPTYAAHGQECDDGNRRSGDGCSSDCKREPGFACLATNVAGDQLLLPIVYRDFKAAAEAGGHPDFESFVGEGEPNIVQPALDGQGKPAHVAAPRNLTVNDDPAAGGVDYFAMWYRDTPRYNRTVRDLLPLARLAVGAFRFESLQFFPIDGRGWGNYLVTPDARGLYRNFHFTSEVRTWFQYQGNERLDFSGDDDVWVFINRRLAVDLGGLHQELAAAVTLDATNGNARVCDLLSPCPGTRAVVLGLEPGKIYEIAVFQAERHTVESHYRLTMANFSGPRSACSAVCGDGVVTAREACDLGQALNTGAYGSCNGDCTLPPRCGDGVVQADQGETCDGDRACPANCRSVVIR